MSDRLLGETGTARSLSPAGAEVQITPEDPVTKTRDPADLLQARGPNPYEGA